MVPKPFAAREARARPCPSRRPGHGQGAADISRLGVSTAFEPKDVHDLELPSFHRQTGHAVLQHGTVRRIGDETVETAISRILGLVHHVMDRVDRSRLMVERAQRRLDHGVSGRAEWVALVDLAIGTVLLAGQPGAPGRRSARAVPTGAGENGVGVDQVAVRVEPQGANPAEARRQLGVGDIHPAPIGLRREHRAAIRKDVPVVARQRRFVDQRVQPCACHHAYVEASRRVNLFVDARDCESTDGLLLQRPDIRQWPRGQMDAAGSLCMRRSGQPARRRGRCRAHEYGLQDSASRHRGQQGLLRLGR